MLNKKPSVATISLTTIGLKINYYIGYWKAGFGQLKTTWGKIIKDLK